jgi:YidC/Oxa1 family membrane protein insertase
MIRVASKHQSIRRVSSARPLLSNIEIERKKADDDFAARRPLSSSWSSTCINHQSPSIQSSYAMPLLQQQRFYSSTRIHLKEEGFDTDATSTMPSDIPSVDDTLDKLFQDKQETTDAWFAASDAATQNAVAIAWDPHWYNLADQAVQAVLTFHNVTGAEWAVSIVGVTIILRAFMFPLMVSSQRNTTRMAHLQPELTLMKQRYEALGAPSRQDQLQFANRMKALFAKYEVKPLRAFAAPVAQFPLFMGMFFGLKKMPELFPTELATGGMLWFPDLTVPDPYYILPIASATSFLLLIEMGKEQMMAQNPAQGQLMLNVFRVMSLVMLPVCVNFESAMLCYWTSNNILTMCQTKLLKTKSVRKYLGIWEPPKPVPGLKAESITETATKLIKKVQGEATSDEQRMKQHNQSVEIKKKARRFGFMKRDSKIGITGKRV